MVKFGVCVPQDRKKYEDIQRTVVRSEELGFDSVWLFDHLHSFPRPNTDPFLECWTTLSALAGATRRIRLGPLVSNVQYRNPALLAKMATTLDHISNGRLGFGIGAGGTGRAGWAMKLGYTPEYEAFGMDFPEKASARIKRLEEAVHIIKRLWTESSVTLRGRYYQVENAFCSPRPIQRPHPPIWIGGTGERLLLKVVAEFADACNFAWDLSPQAYFCKLSTLDEYCRACGRSPSSIRKSLLAACVTSERADDVKTAIHRITEAFEQVQGYVPYALRQSALTGTTDECIRKIDEFRRAGVSDFILAFPEEETDEWLERFAKSVMPSF